VLITKKTLLTDNFQEYVNLSNVCT